MTCVIGELAQHRALLVLFSDFLRQISCVPLPPYGVLTTANVKTMDSQGAKTVFGNKLNHLSGFQQDPLINDIMVFVNSCGNAASLVTSDRCDRIFLRQTDRGVEYTIFSQG